MFEPLLATKLTIPQTRPHLVSRTRLLETLEANLWQASGFARKLTLISAPAGYGKTTLIADWISHIADVDSQRFAIRHPRFCWLSLDEEDNDPIRFLIYFIAALKGIDEKIGLNAQAMLQSPQPPPPQVWLTTLINDIAEASIPFILVLDDYQFLKTPAIHMHLTFLLEHQPSQMHLVLLTREDPPIPLSRLRARGQISEIRQADLRFTLEETASYLRGVLGLELSSQDIAALERRTEGWVAGLQLAALSMQGRTDLTDFIKAFTGSNRYILDYLIEEVFQRQTAEVQEFLLKTSILDQLSAPLCDVVADRTGSHEVLLSLEQANLFIEALDQNRQWYRFHRLFAELLRHRLRVSGEISPSLLHKRASQWYLANGLQAEAVQHALAADDWESAADIIQGHKDAMLKRGEVVTLLGWFKQLPEEIIRARPDLCTGYAWALLLIGQLDYAESLLTHAERYAQEEPQFHADVASAQAYLARSRGDAQRTIEKSQQALSLFPKDNLTARSIVAVNLGLAYWHAGMLNEAEPALREAYDSGYGSGNTYAAVTAKVFLGRTYAARAELDQAADQYREVIRESAPIPMLAITNLDLSALHYEWNDLKEALEYQRRGLELSVQSGNVEFQIAAEMILARLKLAQGAFDAAFQAAHRANQMAQDFSLFTRARTASCLAQVALARDDLDGALYWGEQMQMAGDFYTFYMFLNLTKARLLIAQGKMEEAAMELEACYEKASPRGWGYGLIVVRVLQSLTAGTTNSALEFLKDALNRAKPQRFIRTFTDAGDRLIPLLREAALRGVLPDYVGEILATLGQGARSSEASPLIEPLSEREIEVLRLLTAGLSNRQIAEKLTLSLGTVKTHVHNIYGKLQVPNRTLAIARAKELGLL